MRSVEDDAPYECMVMGAAKALRTVEGDGPYKVDSKPVLCSETLSFSVFQSNTKKTFLSSIDKLDSINRIFEISKDFRFT